MFCCYFCVVSLHLHKCLGMRAINVLIETRCQSSLDPGVHRTRSSSILSSVNHESPFNFLLSWLVLLFAFKYFCYELYDLGFAC